MPSQLNPILCGSVIGAAWIASERPALWPEEHRKNRTALEHVAQVIGTVLATWRACQAKIGIGPLPHPDRTADLMALMGCANACPSLRALETEEQLARVLEWVQALAAGIQLSPEVSAQAQLFFGFLSGITVTPVNPMCGVPLQGTPLECDDD